MIDGTGPRGAPGRTRLVAELPREETLANRVVAELEPLIGESRLGEGDRLPSERELAAQFGVSRTVVREAVRALAARRLVEVEGGRGTVVRPGELMVDAPAQMSPSGCERQASASHCIIIGVYAASTADPRRADRRGARKPSPRTAP